MYRLLSYRPSPAMVVALLALLVSLSGSAVAALKLQKNSVGTKQLKNGAVTGAKLHAGAVTASKVKPHSLLASDFKTGQLPTGAAGLQVVASGQTGVNATLGGPSCHFGTGTTFCNPTKNPPDVGGLFPPMTFIPSRNAICQVSLDGQIVMNGGAHANVQYGIGQNTSSGDQTVDPNQITTTAGQLGGTALNAGDVPRSRLVSVTAGTQYTFEPWVTNSASGTTGTIYFNMTYVCFG